MNILEVNSLEKSFGSKEVLKGISFCVSENSVFGFIGRNGAGKTTTIKAILGLLSPDKGEISVCGKRVRYGNTPTNRCIGYLPDVPEFYGFMTANEYLTLCGGITGIPQKELKGRCNELLKLVGLGGEKHRIKGYSRGMKQRLGIAQALISRPKLLICDEPTSALDPVGRKDILDIISSAKEHTSVLFSTHILSDVERICDSMVLLEDGKAALSGTMEELRSMRSDTGLEVVPKDPSRLTQLKKVFPESEIKDKKLVFAKASSETEFRVMAYLSAQRIELQRIERHEADLEDLFMEVIGK